MRCLALANALRVRGARCAFLARLEGLGALAAAIEEQGHSLLRLVVPAVEQDVQQQDAALCQAALTGLTPARWLVVDHYALGERWESAMRKSADKLMVIDDLADRPHACELLLDQNLVPAMQARYAGKLPEGCLQLLGPRFALLRPEFDMPTPARSVAPQTLRVLLMFGGADPKALTLRVLQVLARRQWKVELDVVAGSLFNRLDALRQLLAYLPKARLHVSTPDIAQLMRRADLAIGSPGVSSWERCSTGLPALAISQAGNQEEVGHALAEAGAHLYLGSAESVADEDIEAALQLLLSNPGLRTAMGRSASAICDGKGSARVARLLWRMPMRMRPVVPEDAPLLFAWRNDERTRCHSMDPRPLQFEAHGGWLKQVLANRDEILLLGLQDDAPAVCVRFSCRGERARISIYTDPERQGQGLGPAALDAATQWLRQARPAIRTIEAEVLHDNQASHAMFRAAAYSARWTRYETGP